MEVETKAVAVVVLSWSRCHAVRGKANEYGMFVRGANAHEVGFIMWSSCMKHRKLPSGQLAPATPFVSCCREG